MKVEESYFCKLRTRIIENWSSRGSDLYASHSAALVPVNVALFSDITHSFPSWPRYTQRWKVCTRNQVQDSYWLSVDLWIIKHIENLLTLITLSYRISYSTLLLPSSNQEILVLGWYLYCQSLLHLPLNFPTHSKTMKIKKLSIPSTSIKLNWLSKSELLQTTSCSIKRAPVEWWSPSADFLRSWGPVTNNLTPRSNGHLHGVTFL